MQHDDKPVGTSSGNKDFAGGPEPDEDFSKSTLDQLLINSNWKARKGGFERIANNPKKLKSTFFDKLTKVSAEGNAAAQEALFEALVSLVPVCDNDEQGLLCSGPLALAVEKGITGRPKAVSLSAEFVSLLVENGRQSEVLATLLPAFTHKTPKNRAAAAQLCGTLVQDYGVQPFPTKEILRAMQPLFNDPNPQVRKEALALCCNCYKYLGAAIKSFLSDLRDVQMQELEKQFESVTVGGQPPKKVKGAAAVGGSTEDKKTSKTSVAAAASSSDGKRENTEDLAFQLMDETPVLPKLPRDFFPRSLDKKTPWQDRCEYVTNTLLPLLSAQRLRAKDDYHELAAMIKLYLTDPQAPLMLLGFQMIQECARGLRESFASYARVYINPLFDKMKDKKTSVLLHVTATLEKLVICHSLTMDQYNEEIEQVSQSKNPSQRLALMNFCIHMIDLLDSSQYQRLGRSVNMLKRMANDEKASHRDVAYILIDKLSAAFGPSQYNSIVSSMDDKQKARMQTVLTSSASQPTSALATPKSAVATPSNSPAKKFPRVDDPTASRRNSSAMSRASSAHVGRSLAPGMSATGRPSQSANSARPTTGLGSGRARARGGAGDSNGPSLDDPISLESTLPPTMESMNAMLGLLGGDTAVLDLLRSREWSQRLDGMLKVKNTVNQWTSAEATKYFNVLVVYLRAVPGMKESTFQVFQAVLSTLSETVAKTTTISPGAGCAIVASCTPRLTEAKNRQPVRDICTAVAHRWGQRFVIHHMMLVAKDVKTPKLLQECNDYFVELISGNAASSSLSKKSSFTGTSADEGSNAHAGSGTFSAAGQAEVVGGRLDIKGILEYLKHPCFDQTVPLTRQSAMQVLVALHGYDAEAVQQALSSFPPHVVTQFEQLLARGGEGAATVSSTPASPHYPTLPRPRPSSASSPHLTNSAASSTTMGGSASSRPSQEMPQKRVRNSSQPPSTGARGRSGSMLAGRADAPSSPNPSSSQHSRSSTSRQDALNTGSLHSPASNSNSTTNRVDSGHPRPSVSSAGGAGALSEEPSGLRQILRDITRGADWRDRLDGVHKVSEFIDSNGGTISGGAANALLKALGERYDESNKNFVVDVLRCVQTVVAAAGYDESRDGLRKVLPGAFSMLGDQKMALREEARKVVFLGMDVCGLESLLQALQRPLGSDSSVARQNTLEAMIHGFEQFPPDLPVPRAGLQQLLPLIVRALMDRIFEVRSAAEQVIGFYVPAVGEEPILRLVQQLKPADQQSVLPAIQRQLQLHPPVSPAVIDGPASSDPLNTDNEEEERAAETSEGREDGYSANARRSMHRAHTPSRASGGGSVATTPRRGPTTPRRASSVPAGASTPSRRRSVTPHMQTTAAAGTGNAAGAPVLATGAVAAAAAPATVTELLAPLAEPGTKGTRPTPIVATPAVQASSDRNPQERKETTGPAAAPANANAAKVSPRKSSGSKPAPLRREVVMKEHPEPSKDNEEMYSLQDILAGLKSATPAVAYNMCTDFMRHFRDGGEDCGTPEMLQTMVERLYENTRELEPELALGLIGCLCAMFVSPRSAARCHSSLIFRVIGTMFDCLLSEQFSLNEVVLKAMNTMTLKLLEGCTQNDVFSALMSRMTSYSTTYLQSSRRGDLKFIQVTVKCLMRLDLEQVSPDNVVLCCHEYLLQHPPSAFRNLDDLPIRTVKTVLQTTTRRVGKEFLASATQLVGPQNLVTHFIRACLDSRDKAVHQRESNEKNAVEESVQQQRASQSPAPKGLPARSSTPSRATVGATATTVTTALSASKTISHADPTTGTTTVVATTTASQQSTTTTVVPTPISTMPRSSSAPAGVKTPHPQPKSKVLGSPASIASPTALPSAPQPTPKTPVAHAGNGNSAGGSVGSSTAPAPAGSTAVPPAPVEEKPMATIFARIRNHVTSQQGIDELYTHLKDPRAAADSEEEFTHQYLRCSEAFRLYIKRKLDRKVAEDPAVPSDFKLPAAMASPS